jgi:hypothetical protein
MTVVLNEDMLGDHVTRGLVSEAQRTHESKRDRAGWKRGKVESQEGIGTVVPVFLLARSGSADTWSGNGSGNQLLERRFYHVGLN